MIEALSQGRQGVWDVRERPEEDRVVHSGAHHEPQQVVHQRRVQGFQAELTSPHRPKRLVHRLGEAILDIVELPEGLGVVQQQRSKGRPEHLEVGLGGRRLVEE